MTKDEQIENLRETIEHMGRRLQAKDEEIDRLRAANEKMKIALGRLVNDSMYRDHPEASQMAINALTDVGALYGGTDR